MSMPAARRNDSVEDMHGRARTGGAIVQLAGILLGVGDELGDRLDRQLRADRQRAQQFTDPRDRLEIGDRIEIDLAHVRHDREHTGRRHQHGVAVRRGARDDRGADRAGRAALVVDHDGLLHPRGEAVGQHPRDRIAGAAGRERHHHPDRLVRKRGMGRTAPTRQRERRSGRRCPPSGDHPNPCVPPSFGSSEPHACSGRQFARADLRHRVNRSRRLRFKVDGMDVDCRLSARILTMAAPVLPDRARVVVIGGGVIGTSVAYHLAHMGWKDVVLLERDRLTSGTTWHAAGLVVTFGSTSETSTELRKYTRDLYRRLEAETGQATGFNPVGFIEVAADADRLEEYRRVAAFNRLCGVDVQEISPAEVKTLFPLARVDDILAGFYVADDGRANPGGRDHGARQGRAHGRRAPDRRRARRRRAAPGQPRHRRPHRVRRHPGRIRRQLRGHVGAPARRARWRHHPEPGGRALLPDHRADRGPAAVDAGARRPGVVRLFPRGGRRPAGRPVRAGLRAVACRRHPGGFLVRRNSARLGAHDALSREGDEPRPGLARGRDQEILLRPGELHARPAADHRRGARAQELLRGRRAQLDRHPHRRRHRPACLRTGSSTARPTPT